VSAGQTVADLTIRIVSVAAFQVSGRVVDETGAPVANAMITLTVDEPRATLPFMMGGWHQAHADMSGRFTINNVTSGTYTLVAAAPDVIYGFSGPPIARGGRSAGGGAAFTSFGVSGTVSGGSVGGGVTTETTNGTTVQYRDDVSTRMPITVNQESVSGVELVVRTPPRRAR
jgi:hypothetical protein